MSVSVIFIQTWAKHTILCSPFQNAWFWYKKLNWFFTIIFLAYLPHFKMSASDSSSVVPSGQTIIAVVSDKKPRVPTLPAKFAKFIQFGFFLVQKLKNDDGTFDVLDDAGWLDFLQIHGSVDEQQAFVQEFFDESKDINKDLRKIVADKKKADVKAAKLAAKPPKAPKEKVAKASKDKETDKAPKAPKAPKASKTSKVPDSEAEAEALEALTTVLQPTEVDKPKKGKAKKATTVDPFVEELVTLANGPTTTSTTTTTSTVTSTTDKPKRKYNKKTPEPTVSDAKADNDNDNDHDELEVEEFSIDGILYLLSKDQRIFDRHTSKPLGFLRDGILLSI